MPHYHDVLANFATDTRKVTNCPVGGDDYVPCPPESLRKQAETFMREAGLRPRRVSLDTYSLARNIRSEHGRGSVEEKVAIAEAARNEASRRGKSITQLLLINRQGRPLYGRQRQGRFAGTSQDPTVGDVQIADYVLRKGTNLTRGATKYLHPGAMSSQERLFEVLHDWAKRNVWVGHIPGILAHEQFMMRPIRPGENAATINAAGFAAIRRRSSPAVPVDVCPTPPNTLLRVAGIGAVSAAVAAGAAYFLTVEAEPGSHVRDWSPRTLEDLTD
ncbi:MAG: hypothetical protein JSV86_17115 [Gemmatimonadota bacterium]|nr:MAG: hypothetical protein JSV86_17115 [Gemmatimonadota bacterium]